MFLERSAQDRPFCGFKVLQIV